MSRAGEKLSLDVFLAELPDEETGAARAAAARIDELARIGNQIKGVERRFAPWAAAAAVLFMVGLWLFFNPGLVSGWLMTACLAALPVVCAAYAWRVRDRTRADNTIDELNKAHFLPHGGLYFPAAENPACVIRVDYTPPPPEPPLSEAPRDPRKKPIRPGRIW